MIVYEDFCRDFATGLNGAPLDYCDYKYSNK